MTRIQSITDALVIAAGQEDNAGILAWFEDLTIDEVVYATALSYRHGQQWKRPLRITAFVGASLNHTDRAKDHQIMNACEKRAGNWKAALLGTSSPVGDRRVEAVESTLAELCRMSDEISTVKKIAVCLTADACESPHCQKLIESHLAAVFKDPGLISRDPLKA